MDARAANDRIAAKAEQLRFVSRVPMLCECNRPGCRKLLMVSLADYHRIRSDPANFLTAPGHEIEGTKLYEETSAYHVRRASGDEGNGSQRSA